MSRKRHTHKLHSLRSFRTRHTNSFSTLKKSHECQIASGIMSVCCVFGCNADNSYGSTGIYSKCCKLKRNFRVQRKIRIKCGMCIVTLFSATATGLLLHFPIFMCFFILITTNNMFSAVVIFSWAKYEKWFKNPSMNEWIGCSVAFKMSSFGRHFRQKWLNQE